MNDQKPGCLGFLFGFGPSSAESADADDLPFRKRDNFLSPAELSFYKVLEQAIESRYTICPKVRIADLVYVVQRNKNMKHANQIERKHVDFVLCENRTMQPLLVIELDDKSHESEKRKKRDQLVDDVFTAAGLPILHTKAAKGYSVAQLNESVRNILGSAAEDSEGSNPKPTPEVEPKPTSVDPTCPKCSVPLVLRKASKGKHKGKQFWACPSYPECKHIQPISQSG